MAGNPQTPIHSALRTRTTGPQIFIALLAFCGMAGCAHEVLRSSGQVPWRRTANEREPLRFIPIVPRQKSSPQQKSSPELPEPTGKQEIGGWSGPETVTRLTGIVLPVPRRDSGRETLSGPQIAPRRLKERRSQPDADSGHNMELIPGPADRRSQNARPSPARQPADTALSPPESLSPPEEASPASGTMPLADEPVSDAPGESTPPASPVRQVDPTSRTSDVPRATDTLSAPSEGPGSSRGIPDLDPNEPGPGLEEDDRAESPGQPAAVRESPTAKPQTGAPEGPRQSVADDTSPQADGPEVVPATDPAAGPPVPREPSMLNRIRELYSPRTDENPGELIRKQFRRLQSPWGLRRERNPGPPETGNTTETQTAEIAPGTSPEVSADAEEPQPPSLQPLIDILQQELKDWPRDGSGLVADADLWRQRQTDLRLLQIVAGQPAEAMRVIEGLPEEEQEFWQSLMMSLNYYRGTQHDQLSRENQLLAASEELRAAVRHIQALSPIRIRRMEFCSAINGFGSVEGFPSADFSTGQPVLIYAEVENFRSQLTEQGTYHTEFSAVLEILRDDQLIESIPIDVIADDAGTRRTDFFLSFDDLTIPAHLNPGQYSVRLRLRDQLSRQQADASLPFNVR